MTEEERKTILGDLYEKLNKAQQGNQHQAVLDHTDKIMQLDTAGSESEARLARLTALVKTKNFEQALELIKKGRKSDEKGLAFEHAYILHRLGRNKEALEVLQKGGDIDSTRVKHLLAQVQYKLGEYKASVNLYTDLFSKTDDEEDIADIVTNLLACASNQDSESIAMVDRIVEKTSHGQLDRTYEFFFNLSQVQMKQQLHQEAFKSLIKSYEIAKQDDEHNNDQTRFKIQELHALNTFSHEFSVIEYNAGGSVAGPRFNLPRSLKHDNLVELNMSALAQENGSFEAIDREHFKEIIGNLNWNKFAERITNQLQTNPNLTAEQKRLMQVNLVVALIRSNQFDMAKMELAKVADHQAVQGIGAFFSLKDKKYDEALQQIKNAKDSYSVFLKAQIHIAKKENKTAFEILASNVSDDLLNQDSYLIFLLRQSVHYKINPVVLDGLVKKLLSIKKVDYNKDLLLTISDIFQQQGNPKKSIEILKSLFDKHGGSDKLVQGKYLALLVDSGNLQEAIKLQQKLPKHAVPETEDDDDYVQRLIEDGMPEKRKEKKTRDIIQETKGGAEIFMPSRKRKRTIKYPKNFDPKNPGPEPDHERWLPKWQRSRFKKIAKKKGIYLKGAQGDAQIDTDVTGGITQSTAHQEAVSEKQKTNKRRKK